MSENKMVADFIQKRDEEERVLTVQFAREILSLQLEKKAIDDSIKAIKADAKANGVLVGKVTKALADIKRILKTEDTELSEEERIKEMLESEEDLKALIYDLISEK